MSKCAERTRIEACRSNEIARQASPVIVRVGAVVIPYPIQVAAPAVKPSFPIRPSDQLFADTFAVLDSDAA